MLPTVNDPPSVTVFVPVLPETESPIVTAPRDVDDAGALDREQVDANPIGVANIDGADASTSRRRVTESLLPVLPAADSPIVTLAAVRLPVPAITVKLLTRLLATRNCRPSPPRTSARSGDDDPGWPRRFGRFVAGAELQGRLIGEADRPAAGRSCCSAPTTSSAEPCPSSRRRKSSRRRS